MKHTVKVLGLALAAVFALSAIVASAASATTTFTAESEAKLTVSANETQVFTYTAGGAQIKCTGFAVDNAQIVASSTEIEFTPTYTGCTGPGGITTHITMSGPCTITVKADSTVYFCRRGGKITFTVTGLCTYHLTTQQTGSVSYDNIGSGTTREIKVTPSVTGIATTNTNPGFLCGPESSTTGTLSGSFTLTGENSAGTAHIGITTD